MSEAVKMHVCGGVLVQLLVSSQHNALENQSTEKRKEILASNSHQGEKERSRATHIRSVSICSRQPLQQHTTRSPDSSIDGARNKLRFICLLDAPKTSWEHSSGSNTVYGDSYSTAEWVRGARCSQDRILPCHR